MTKIDLKSIVFVGAHMFEEMPVTTEAGVVAQWCRLAIASSLGDDEFG